MATVGGPNIITDGLVLHLDAGNHKSYPGSGTTWYDISGNNNDGALLNNTTLTDGVFSFDGTDDSVLIGTGSDYNSLTNLTIESVTKFKRETSYEYILSNARDCCGTNDYSGYELRLTSSRYLAFTIWNTTRVLTTSTSQLDLDAFYHITATYDGSTKKIYINSVLDKSSATTNGIGTPASYPLRIGAMGYSSTYEIQGEIGFVKLHNRALTASEVSLNYNAIKSRFNL